MSFGFSPGDIVLFLGFASKIIKALRDEGGSRSEYRLAEQQCQDFLTVMEDVQQFDLSNLPSSSRSKIEEHMTHSQEFVNDFKQTIYKYEKAMGKNSRRRLLSGAPRKIQWAISAADNIDKFRQGLSAQLSIVQLTISKTILSIVAGSNQPQQLVPGPAHNNALRKMPYNSCHKQKYLDWDYNQINAPEFFNRIDYITKLVYERILARPPALHLANDGIIHTLPDDANFPESYPLLGVIPKGQNLLSTDQLNAHPFVNQRQVEYSGYQHTFADELNEYLRSLCLEELSDQETEHVNQIRNQYQRFMLCGSHEPSSEIFPQERMNNQGPPSGENWHEQSKFRPIIPPFKPLADLTSGTSITIQIMQIYYASVKAIFAIKKSGTSEELLVLSRRIMQYSTLLQTTSSIIRTSMPAEQQRLAWEITQDSQVIIEKVRDFVKLTKQHKALTLNRDLLKITQSFLWRRNKHQVLLFMSEIESLKSTLSIVLQTHQIKISERSFEDVEFGRKMQRDFLHSNASILEKRIC